MRRGTIRLLLQPSLAVIAFALSFSARADGNLVPSVKTVTYVEGTAKIDVVGGFTDAPPDSVGSYSATIDWGDMTPTTMGTISMNMLGGFDITATHTYAKAGSFPIKFTIAEPDGPAKMATSTAQVNDAALMPGPLTIHPVESNSWNGVVGTFADANPLAT